jgi:PAS domain S-box-containing protein
LNKNRPVFSKNEIGRRSHELTAPTIMKETTESEALQWLFNNAGDAVYVLDNQGKFVAVNQKVEEITELRREDYIGKSFRKLIPAKNLPEAMKAHKNVLQGKSTMLNTKMKKASQMEEKSKEMLGFIESDIKYSNKIVSDLLNFSGYISLHPTQIRVKSLMGRILSKIEVPKKVQILELTGGTLKVFVDGIQMMRAFGNLITNAIEAMPKGGKLEIKSEKTKNCLKITFRDTGVGISRKNLRKLFTPLFTTKAKGIGMGLAICKRIISVHGGSIDVKSKEGAGTLVTVAIPLREEKDKHKK